MALRLTEGLGLTVVATINVLTVPLALAAFAGALGECAAPRRRRWAALSIPAAAAAHAVRYGRAVTGERDNELTE